MNNSIIIAVMIIGILIGGLYFVFENQMNIDTNSIPNTVSKINNSYPIDSTCDWFLVYQLEYQLPEPSQWYLDNFFEEYDALRTLIEDERWWDDEDYQAMALEDYHESIKQKMTPELRDFNWEMLESGEEYFDRIMSKDPQCHEIIKTNYPGFNAFR